MLVNIGIDVNDSDGVDAPLIHVAASHSKPEIVQFLIARGADVTVRSPRYGSPLIAALEGFMAPFLRSGSQPENCRYLAEQLPRPDISVPDFFTVGGTVSLQKSGYEETRDCERIVGRLFDAGGEMDTTIRNFGNALHLASYMGSQVIVLELLRRTKDVNFYGGYFESPLIAAVKGAHRGGNYESPLIAAVRGEHGVIVELLLKRGIEVNRSSPEHGSALRCACLYGKTRLTQSLLDYGADVNAHVDSKHSILAGALSRSEEAEYLCRIDIPKARRRGSRILREQREIVEMLLRQDCKVQIRECDLLAAISSDSSIFNHEGFTKSFTSLFLKHDESAVATETVIVKAFSELCYSSVGDETLALLLKHDGGLRTTPAMLKAARSGKAMRLLLEHQADCKLTVEIVMNLMTE